MRVRLTLSTAVFGAATLAVTAASLGPAEAFFFPILPVPVFQNHPVEGRQGRSPIDNKWRDDTARPVKRSTNTRSRDGDEEKSSSTPSKRARSATKSETKASSGHDADQSSRSWNVKHEPAPSKSSGRASVAERPSKSGGRASIAAQHANPGSSTSTAVQEASPASSSPSIRAQETGSSAKTIVGDTYDENLGEVFQARIDELLKQSPK